jgi:dihydroxyacetone kinase-like predicted kinase
VQGDFAVIGDDQFAVATELLRRLLGGGGELVTLVGGVDAVDLPGRCEEWVGHEYPGVDVVIYDGGQDRYPLLLAVE